jgi:hypothetical protein
VTVSDTVLRRYTDFTALTYLLTKREITFLDPRTWDDRNDSHYLKLYRKKHKFQTVLALCFTQARETYHHWRVFANGSSGVCIEFKRDVLLDALRKHGGIHSRAVKYLTAKEMTTAGTAARDLPFLKRHAFEDEREFRILFASTADKLPKLDIPIPLESIKHISLSPWLHHDLSDPLIHILRSISGCRVLKISHSSLINNERWKNFGEAAK